MKKSIVVRADEIRLAPFYPREGVWNSRVMKSRRKIARSPRRLLTQAYLSGMILENHYTYTCESMEGRRCARRKSIIATRYVRDSFFAIAILRCAFRVYGIIIVANYLILNFYVTFPKVCPETDREKINARVFLFHCYLGEREDVPGLRSFGASYITLQRRIIRNV